MMKRRNFLVSASLSFAASGCLRMTPSENENRTVTSSENTQTATTTNPTFQSEWDKKFRDPNEIAVHGGKLYTFDESALLEMDPRSSTIQNRWFLPGDQYFHVEISDRTAYCVGKKRIDSGERVGPWNEEKLVVAVDLEGEKDWVYRHPYESGSRPWVANGLVAIANSTTDVDKEKAGSQNRTETVVLDAETGEVHWRVPTSEMQNGKQWVPGVAFDGQLLAVFGRSTHLFDVNTRTHIGTIPADSTYTSPTLVDGFLYSADYTLEKFDWENQELDWRTTEVGAADVSPSVTEKEVLVGTRDGVGSYSKEDGTERWFTPTKGKISAPLIPYGNFVLAGDDDGILHVISLSDGSIRKSLDLWDGIVSTARFNRMFFIGTSKNLFKYTIPT